MRELGAWTLRQRRYVRILAAMAVVALGCIAAGSFEAHRYAEKRRDNHALIVAARATPTALTQTLVPTTSGGTVPDTQRLMLRRVTATGRYLTAEQTYVGGVSQGGHQGFYVLTPLRTGSGAVLLVARGFVAAVDGTEQRPDSVPAPPTASVTVTGRLSPGQAGADRFGRLGRGEVQAINPAQQASRLGASVYGAWASLASGEPGASGLDALPGPDLGNPSGGAAQWQLLSYVVQWYAFALLALLAPFLFARAEVRDARRRFLGVDDDAEELSALSAPSASGARPELQTAGSTIVRRGSGELARTDPDSPVYRQAARLADRYGRSLTTSRTAEPVADEAGEPVGPHRRRPVADALRRTFSPQVTADSRVEPHRSVDAYQGSYNDYLWQLAMADGEVPDSAPAPAAETGPERLPRVVEVDPNADEDRRG